MGLRSAQYVHARPAGNELIVHHPAGLLPNRRLRGFKRRPLNLVGEMVWNEPLTVVAVRLSTQRHFIENAHDALLIERYAQNTRAVRGDDEVGDYAVHLPLEGDEIAGNGNDVHANVDWLVDLHSPMMGRTSIVGNPPLAEVALRGDLNHSASLEQKVAHGS